MTLMVAATISDSRLMTSNVISIMHLPELELDGDFNQDIHRRTLAGGGRESPLAHGLNRPLVEAGAKPLQYLHVADRTVARDDDLHHHFTLEAAAPRVFAVVGLDLAQQAGRLDARPGAKRAATCAAAGAWTDAGSVSRAEARPGAGSSAATLAWPVTRGLGLCACSNTPIRLRSSAGADTIGATRTGSGSELSGGGGGSGGATTGSTLGGGLRIGTGLLTFRRPSRSAFGRRRGLAKSAAAATAAWTRDVQVDQPQRFRRPALS